MIKLKPYKSSIVTAFGIIFIISSTIVPIQNLIVWGPGLILDFYISSKIIAEKTSTGVMVLDLALILFGYKIQVHVE